MIIHLFIFIVVSYIFGKTLEAIGDKLLNGFNETRFELLHNQEIEELSFLFTDDYGFDDIKIKKAIMLAISNKVKSDDCLDTYAPELVPMMIQANKRAYKLSIETKVFNDSTHRSDYHVYVSIHGEPSSSVLKEGIRVGLLQQLSRRYNIICSIEHEKKHNRAIAFGIILFSLIWPLVQYQTLGHIS